MNEIPFIRQNKSNERGFFMPLGNLFAFFYVYIKIIDKNNTS